jgi:hypothetical protein
MAQARHLRNAEAARRPHFQVGDVAVARLRGTAMTLLRAKGDCWVNTEGDVIDDETVAADLTVVLRDGEPLVPGVTPGGPSTA